jgi:membrane-bound metal-dependent hydrolase YbcI (DUF457 family)
MFVGHGLLAFAVTAWFADRLGWNRERALSTGALAAVFGTIPDVDMLYVPVVLLRRLSFSPNEFWTLSTVAHRTVTHSLVVGAVLTVAVGLLVAGGQSTRPRRQRHGARLGTAGLVCVLVAVTAATSGRLEGVLLAVFGLTTLGVAAAGVRFDIAPRVVTATAAVGLLTHPFGDLLTGSPPPLLYPLDTTVFTDVVTLHPDPTVHLLGAFAVELATVWLSLLVYLRVGEDWRPALREHAVERGGLGLGYAVVLPLFPAPTLDESYQFVFSVLAVGLVLALSTRRTCRQPLCLVVTGLSAVTFAWGSYVVAYLLLG